MGAWIVNQKNQRVEYVVKFLADGWLHKLVDIFFCDCFSFLIESMLICQSYGIPCLICLPVESRPPSQLHLLRDKEHLISNQARLLECRPMPSCVPLYHPCPQHSLPQSPHHLFPFLSPPLPCNYLLKKLNEMSLSLDFFASSWYFFVPTISCELIISSKWLYQIQV